MFAQNQLRASNSGLDQATRSPQAAVTSPLRGLFGEGVASDWRIRGIQSPRF